jgi:hypothetical protein
MFQIEKEGKKKNFDLKKLFEVALYFLRNDITNLNEVERLYQLKGVQLLKKVPCDVKLVEKYMTSSIEVSERILAGKVNNATVVMFPTILTDKFFNETGLESEQASEWIRNLNDQKTMSPELQDLIIKHAYLNENVTLLGFETYDKTVGNLANPVQANSKDASQ